MANPQKEDGYTSIAHEIMEALAKIRIPGQARQILDVILRQTYGWNKCEAKISLGQFAKRTGLSKVHICRGINKLISMNIVTKKGNAFSYFTKKGNDYDVTYGLQKDFDKWHTLPKKITLSKKITNVIQKDNVTLSKKITLPIKQSLKQSLKQKRYIVEQPVKNQIPYQEIIEYLNQKAGKNFRYTSKETQSLIKARWNQGFRLDVFKYVIDIKCQKWLTDPKMIDYLRPQTLFGTKFESYLNETAHPLQNKVSNKTIQSIEALNEWEREETKNEKQN